MSAVRLLVVHVVSSLGGTMLDIFIGWDSRFPEPADVLAQSIRDHASVRVRIRFLKYAELQRDHGFDRAHDPLASTEFTYTRFLVPFLKGYRGKALFLDNDMLCLGDVAELDRLDMGPYALRVVQHDHRPQEAVKMYGCPQTSYLRKNWSSLMLMDCSRLTLWTKVVVESASGAYLHRFQDIPDSLVGTVPPEWNHLDRRDATTKLVHWTSGGPWFEEYRDCPHALLWLEARDRLRALRRGRRDAPRAGAAPEMPRP
jgi:hypothetical protein